MVIHNIIFDFDGVIADSFPLRHEIAMRICPLFGKTCPENIDELRAVWGDHAGQAFKALGFTDTEVAQATEIFKVDLGAGEPPMFAGAADVLKTLAEQYTLIVLTANKQETVQRRLEVYGVAHYFERVIGNETIFDADFKVDKVGRIVSYMDHAGVTPEQVLFIADRDIDRRDALLAGIPSGNVILVDYGFGHTTVQPWRIDSPAALLPVVQQIAGATSPIK